MDPVSIPLELISFSNVTIDENNVPGVVIENIISVNDLRLNTVVFHFGRISGSIDNPQNRVLFPSCRMALFAFMSH